MDKTFFNKNIEDLFSDLNTRKGGLSSEEANKRLLKYGPNTLPTTKPKSFLRRLKDQLNNVLIYILLIAAIITAFLEHWIDCSVILAVVFINAVIGIIQEGKAEKALAAISHLIALQATVVRNGRRQVIDASQIVPGDIVRLKAGDRISSDMRLFSVTSLQVDEAALTGESIAVDKSTATLSTDTPLADRSNMAYAGTLVTYGRGFGVVVATGMDTEIGRISHLVELAPPITTPLLQQIKIFGRWLSLAIILFAIFTFLFGLFLRDYSINEMFLAAVALAVSAIPEGLPAIMTITLAIGVTRMAHRHAIIRRLPVVETMGAVSVICTDKTGTLTRNELSIQHVVTAKNNYQVTGIGYAPSGIIKLDNKKLTDIRSHEELLRAINAVVLCNDAELQHSNGEWQLHGNPVDGALLTLGLKASIERYKLEQEFPRLDYLPFSSEQKLMASLHEDADHNRLIIVKGAPEKILELCQWEAIDGQVQMHSATYWSQQIDHLAKQGYRVIAVAQRKVSEHIDRVSLENLGTKFTFLALFALIDPPRDETKQAIADCHSAGIKVKMITGDHAKTATAIAKQIKLNGKQIAITGSEIDTLSDEQLATRVEDINIYARTTPEHKIRLIKALKANGEIVAMTGDGVNDAPAVRYADVGCAMGIKGTEATREAAEMIIADDNFASIRDAVEEGRTVYENLKKAILFILPSSGGEALTIIWAVLMGVVLPITPVQILWVNLVTTVTLALSLSFEPTEKDIMRNKPRKPNEALLSSLLVWRTILVSLLYIIATFSLFWFEYQTGSSLAVSRTVAVNTIVVAEIVYLINCRKISKSVINRDGIFGNSWVLFAIASVIFFQLLFTYTPFMQYLFNTAALTITQWSRIILVGVALFFIVEIEKYITRKLSSK